MEIKNCDVFGYIAVEPVTIRKKNQLFLPQTGGMHASRIGHCLFGKFKDEYVLYLTHTEIRAEYKGQKFWFIPIDACYALIEPGEDDIVESLFEVDASFGVDMEWYGPETARQANIF